MQFQSHAGQTRSLGQLQLSNPSDLLLYGLVSNWHLSARSSTSLANSVTDFVPSRACISLNIAIERLTFSPPCFRILAMAASRLSGAVPAVVTPASLANRRNWRPPHRRTSFSFWALSFMPIESASRLVWSYQSSVFQVLGGVVAEVTGLPGCGKSSVYHFTHLVSCTSVGLFALVASVIFWYFFIELVT